MNRHLTKDELIKYQFDLLEQDEKTSAAEHLAQCSECQAELENLQDKFSALDLLSNEAMLGEELIVSTAAQAKSPAKPKMILFVRAAWLGAAAMLIVAAGVIVTQLPKQREKTKTTTVARGDEAKEMENLKFNDERSLGHRAKGTMYMGKEVSLGTTFARDGDIAIDEKPPFAPASAIELVTLPRRDNVQLTIYNSADLTLVREKRSLTLKKGWNWLQFMWANTAIDPTSLSLEAMQARDKIDIQQLVYPARLKDIGRWLIKSEVEGQYPFEITYFTSGLSWRAFYMGTLAQDEKTMEMKGYVRVANGSGEDYEDAQTRLIVGKVNQIDQIADLARRRWPYGSPTAKGQYGQWFGESNSGLIDEDFDDRHRFYFDYAKAPVAGGIFKGVDKKEIVKEGLSEYFLYTIEGTETIENNWAKRLESFAAEDIKVKSLYKYDEGRFGKETIRYVAFVNDEEHNLGETPLPDGTVKIYGKADDGKGLSYVGGTSVKYIPVEEEVELNLGAARLVKVEPKLMKFETDNHEYNKDRDIVGWDEIRTWELETTNARELEIEVEITRNFVETVWTIKYKGGGLNYEKHDVTHGRFNMKVAPRSKKKFEYTITTYHGTRAEAYLKN